MCNRASVITKIKEGIAIAEKHYGITIRMPTIHFAKRGTVAGTANYGKWMLNFNEVLLNENFDTFIETTVPHELAHLVDHQVNGSLHNMLDCRGRRMKRQPHGINWQNVMRVLGAEPNRCHNYDVSNARARKPQTRTLHNYQCTGCKSILTMGATRHNNMQAGKVKYSHKSCKGFTLLYVGTVK